MSEKEFLKNSIAGANLAIENLNRKKDRLLDLYVEESLDREAFLKKRHELDSLLKENRQIIDRYKKGDADFYEKISKLVMAFHHLPEQCATAKRPSKVKLLKKLAHRVTITINKEIKLEWLEPYNRFISPEIALINKQRDALAVLKHPVVRDGRDSNPRPPA